MQDTTKWKVRRRMAISAFLHLIVMSAVIFIFSNKDLSNFSSIIIAFIGADMSIIGAYIGAVTWSDNKIETFKNGS